MHPEVQTNERVDSQPTPSDVAGRPSGSSMPLLARHFSQGLLMGGADIIPGVSGGTMALIVGIYKDLIAAISDAASAVVTLVRGRVSEAIVLFRGLNWGLLLPVAGGILIAIGIGTLFIPELLASYPIQCRALFFGLVAASLVIPWRERHEQRASHFVVAAVAAALAFILLGIPRGGGAADPSLLRVGLTASIAINAMILPGVSGAYLLEVFGLYSPTLQALRDLDIPYIAAFALGATIGIGLAAKGLSWLLDRHHDLTMTVLVGILAGSLRALWPWVGSVEHVHSDGSISSVPDPSVLLAPGAEWTLALVLAIAGFTFVTTLAWFGKHRLKAGKEALD